MIFNEEFDNVETKILSPHEFCKKDCGDVKYQGCDNLDPCIKAMHDDTREDPIKVKIHGLEDGDKAEVEIEKSSDNEESNPSAEENPSENIEDDKKEIEKMSMDARNVPVYQDNSKDQDTYYVKLADTRRFMEANDMSLTESLDAIIEANTSSTVDADNIALLVEAADNVDDESIEKFKSYGINVVKENSDSDQDDIITESNDNIIFDPISEMKKNPETVPIANINENYYIAGADLINYMEAAEISSVVEALDNIINVYTEQDIDADNICVVMDEASESIKDDLLDAEVIIK